MDEMDYYEYEQSKKLTPMKIIGLICKWIAYLVIISVFAIIFVRIGLLQIPKKFTEFVWTDDAKAALADGSAEILYQEPRESYDDVGYYNVSAVALSPESDEVQFTVRYNERHTINSLMKWYNLAERPTGEVFIYILTDQDGNTYTDYTFAAGSKPMYQYRRVIFSGVDLSAVTTLYLDIYYGDNVSATDRMYGDFVLYDKDLGVLAETYSEPTESKLTFHDAPAYVNKLK